MMMIPGSDNNKIFIVQMTSV